MRERERETDRPANTVYVSEPTLPKNAFACLPEHQGRQNFSTALLWWSRVGGVGFRVRVGG